MPKILTLLTLGLLSFGVLSGCEEDEETATAQASCTTVKVLGRSCDGTMLQLPTDVNLGKTITIEGVSYANVVATYSEVPAGLPESQSFLTGLRLATDAEAPDQACIAIYTSYDLDRVILTDPKCKSEGWCGTPNP
ncbi:hypothetical protein LRS06_05880 [Hymenobacter sp. J193]|uniref:hypothetical protein n=1 Tax=Hymenobacter sp. J193 TaxID=2898429 RepID=UPI002150E108|nr:hypothetical protein [Hymenobacter sp. J193]MCR5887315.1 hypothetical protein [Hymenobacter sp. J193]